MRSGSRAACPQQREQHALLRCSQSPRSPPSQRARSPTIALPAPPQDEVGVRLTQADPGAADWRAMNILTLYYCRPQYL